MQELQQVNNHSTSQRCFRKKNYKYKNRCKDTKEDIKSNNDRLNSTSKEHGQLKLSLEPTQEMNDDTFQKKEINMKVKEN